MSAQPYMMSPGGVETVTRMTPRADSMHCTWASDAQMQRKMKPASRKQPRGNAGSAAVYDGIPGTALSCTPIIMGRKTASRRRPRATAARPPRRPAAP